MFNTMKFDALALVRPTSRDDVDAIIQEILSELVNLNANLDAVEADCAKSLLPA